MSLQSLHDNATQMFSHGARDFAELLQQDADRFFDDFQSAAEVRVECIWEKRRPHAAVYLFELRAPQDRKHVIVKIPYSPRLIEKSRLTAARPETGRPRTTPMADPSIKGLHEFRALQCIDRHFGPLQDPRFGTIRPLQLLEDPYVLIMEKGPSFDLLRGLRKATRIQTAGHRHHLCTLMKHAGGWLREFHGLDRLPHTTDRGITRAEFSATCDAFWEFLPQLGEAPRRVSGLRRRFDKLAQRCLGDSIRGGLSHGDFAPRNVLVGAHQQVTVFDTQARWYAPVFEDLAHFLVAVKASGLQVSSRGTIYSRRDLARFEESFLSGYGDEGLSRDCVRLFECQRLLEWWTSLIFRHRQARGWKRVAKGCRAKLWRGHIISYLDQCVSENE